MNLKVISSGMLNLFVRRFAGPFWIRRVWLKKTQWLRISELEQIQLRLLKRLVRHCYKTVPFYHELMDERGITVESIKTLEDIKQFPILTKKDVLQAGDTLVSRKYSRWLTRTAYTGGTTGSPMTLCRNLFSIGNEHAFVRRQWDWAEIGFKDRCAFLKGRIIVESDLKNGSLCIYDPIMKELHLSTYHLSTEVAKKYAAIINQYKIKAIVGYPSSVGILARVCLDAGIEVKLHSALTTSETLDDLVRDNIARAFDCKVFDFYGSAERVCYIHTCEHGSYHVIPEYGLTQLVPLNGDVDKGLCKIIASGFWNWAMPLIRYDTGDLVEESDESCPCGRAFPKIKTIFGRAGDVIITPSGRELGVSIVSHLVYVICGAENLLESQVIQDAPDHITIEYVPCHTLRPDEMASFKKRLEYHFGNELKVDLEEVKAVQRTESGKIRPVVSKL